MRLWPFFLVATILCWGAYVPTIHHGQRAFGQPTGVFRAFLLVGLAYFLIAVIVPAGLLTVKVEPTRFTRSGVSLSLLAGILGALGALGVILAMKTGAKPIFLAPVLFAGAPIVNTVISLIWDRPKEPPGPWFFAGVLLAATGAALVLAFKPK